MTPCILTISGVKGLPHHAEKLRWFYIDRLQAQEDSRHTACLVDLFGLAGDTLSEHQAAFTYLMQATNNLFS